jgi:hypothetical protein
MAQPWVQRWLRRRSSLGPPMSVSTRLSWPFKAGLCVTALVIAVAGLWGAYQFGLRSAGATQESSSLAVYREKLQKLTAERDQLATTVNAAESRLDIERATEKQLVAQVKVLEAETARLKEDLMFFESLLPAGPAQAGVSIKRLRIDSPAPMQLRYALLLMQGGKGDQEFVGNLQLAVAVVDHGKNAMMVFPDSTTQDVEKFKLSFKHYQRLEGILALPEGLVVKSVQARILQKGQLRAQQSANL